MIYKILNINHYIQTLLKICGILSCSLYFAATTSGVASPLNINVSGFEEIKGNLMIAIYDRAEFFPSQSNNAYLAIKVAITDITMIVEIPDLPEGKYGISLFQDSNKNDELDTGLFGIPTELFGFSNNVRGFAGPPKFKDTLITIKDSPKTISISLD